MSRRNGIMRGFIVQLWIDPAAHKAPGVNCDSVAQVKAFDAQDAARRAFAEFPDCSASDVYGNTKAAPYLGAFSVDEVPA